MQFKDWLLQEDAGSPGAKQALYPMGYGGIGLYPPPDVITWASDAIVYMPKELRELTFTWGDGILSNPFGKDSLYEKTKGKQANQLQAGNLKVDDTKFEKEPSYSTVIPLRTIQAGSLTVDGKGFEKASSFIKDSPHKGGFWDLKQIGERAGKLILPVKLNFSEWVKTNDLQEF
jgi:hypothetical protein